MSKDQLINLISAPKLLGLTQLKEFLSKSSKSIYILRLKIKLTDLFINLQKMN